MVSFSVLLFFLTVVVAVMTSRFNRDERTFMWIGFFGHAVCAIALVLYTNYVFRGGDMIGYHQRGEFLAQMVRNDPRVIADVLALCLGRHDHSLYWIRGAGTSTGTMAGVSALAGLMLGESLATKCLAFAMVAFVGQVGFYFAFKLHLPRYLHRKALIATLLIPSVTFWSSGIIKESITIGGLGICLWGIAHTIKSGFFSTQRMMTILFGAGLVFLSKAYVMFAIALGVGFWLFAERSLRRYGHVRLRLRYMAPGLLFAMLSVFLLGRFFPRYAIQEIAAETSQLQQAYTTLDAGSSYQMHVGVPEDGLRGQLRNMPIALFSSLFRPFILESRNVAMLINSLETLVLMILVFGIVRKRGIRASMEAIQSSPLLLFCFIYVFVFGVAVGLAAPNLGTLSRYRIPMYPAYWMLVLGLLPIKKRRPAPRPGVSQRPGLRGDAFRPNPQADY